MGLGRAAYPGCEARRASAHDELREVTNAILYVLGTGCQWRALPKDFPPRTTAFEYLDLWEWDGTLGRLHHALFLATREQADKEASPTAAIIDSQSVKGAEKGDADGPVGLSRGGRKSKEGSDISWSTRWASRLNVVVHPANIQDRDGGLLILKAVRRLFPFIERIFADGGYQGEATAAAVRALGPWQLD
jgi:putative transposase